MSNFGFGSLFGDSNELARDAGIVTIGDKVAIINRQTLAGDESNSQIVDFSDYNFPSYLSDGDNLPQPQPVNPKWNPNYLKSPTSRPPIPDSEPRIENSKKLLKRFLQDRSFLVFEYPIQAGLKEFSILPFFENISINESQKANFAVYDLIGRAGNLYGYMGAKSRQFNLSFKMNVTHIHHLISTEGLVLQDFSQSFNDPNNKQLLRERFLNQDLLSNTPAPTNNATDRALRSFLNLRTVYDSNYSDSIRGLSEDSLEFKLLNSSPYQKTINTVLWWINLVRSSVINNSANSIFGPPIIRINHGIMYNNVPCVCTNFSIREAQNTIYDVANNFSMCFEVSMSLEEVRNSFGEYKPGDPTRGDNITGWDGLKKYGTMDPNNGPYGGNRIRSSQ